MKFTMSFLTLFLLMTSAWAGTLRDNFDDGDLDGWKLWKLGDQTTQWSVKDGELVSTSQNVCTWASILMIGDYSWRDYEVKADFKVEQIFGLGCGSRSPSVLTILRIAPDAMRGVNVLIQSGADKIFDWCACQAATGVGGNVQTMQSIDCVTVKEGEWYTMRVVANGDNYEMFIDETKICEHKNALPKDGTAGVGAANCEVHFDNVVIKGDDIPNMDLSAAVSPKAKLAKTWGEIKQGRY
jgi:hypothetical protein